MRENKRYLLVNGKIEDVEKSLVEFLGILGMSKTGFLWIKHDKNQGIISINREMINETRAALCVWKDKISVERVSGTLKGLREK
jgi:RNase P/RNase MRP subunit POP5